MPKDDPRLRDAPGTRRDEEWRITKFPHGRTGKSGRATDADECKRCQGQGQVTKPVQVAGRPAQEFRVEAGGAVGGEPSELVGEQHHQRQTEPIAGQGVECDGQGRNRCIEAASASVCLERSNQDSKEPTQENGEEDKSRGGRPGVGQEGSRGPALADAGAEITPGGTPKPSDVLLEKGTVEAETSARRLNFLGTRRGPEQPLDRIARCEVQEEKSEADDAKDYGGAPEEAEQDPARHDDNLVPRVHLGVTRRLVCLALLALACSPVGARRGNTVILASGADLQSANPLVTVHPLAKQVQRYALLVTLIRYDSVLNPAPYLARRWEWSSDSTTLTLKVFRGLRWHDGVPTTAHDAAWTLDAARDPETGYPRRSDLAGLVAVAAENDSTLILRFDRPQTRLPDVLTDLAIVPRHLLGGVSRNQLRTAEWNRNPVGNGPFRFVAHEPNRRWIFSANADFPEQLGGRPKLDRFVVAVVDEPTTKLAALTSGELDFAGINPAHAVFVKQNPDLRVLDYPLLFTYAVLLNLRRPPFDNLAARRAIVTAIEPKSIVDGVLFGYGTPATGPLPPALAPLGPEVSPVAGPSDHSEAPFSFELLTVASGEAALEQMLQAQLARVGIRLQIRQMELSTFLDRIQGPGHDFDAAVLGIAGDLGLGHLARIPALTGLQEERDHGKLVRLLADSTPAVFLYHARGVQGMNRRVEGVRMDLRGELVTLSEWWVNDR